MKHYKHLIFLSSLIWGIAQANPTWIDLSHDYTLNTIYWPTAKEFKLDKVYQGQTPKGYFYSANNYSAAEHGGTHVDAPYHFSTQGITVDQIPLEQLMGNAIVVDVSKQATNNPDYLINIKDFKQWEVLHGQIPANTIILLRTGYEAYWPNPIKYLGTAKRGDKGVAKLHFPGLSEEAATWLVSQRHIKAIGIDTASIDYGQSTLFKAHRILAAANTPIFENVAHLEQLPLNNIKIVALPMKIQHGSGAPLRIAAQIDKTKT